MINIYFNTMLKHNTQPGVSNKTRTNAARQIQNNLKICSKASAFQSLFNDTVAPVYKHDRINQCILTFVRKCSVLKIVLQTAKYASWCTAVATFLHFVLWYVHNQIGTKRTSFNADVENSLCNQC